MSAPSELPRLHAPADCAAGLVPWRNPAGLRLTVVVKQTYALTEQRELEVLAPVELVPRDVHVDRSPLRSVTTPGELAPAMPRAEVVVVGSAFAAQGVAAPAVVVQLQVARGDVLLRKRLHVLGDRARHGETPQPFRSMPIAWERAARGEENPIGVDLASAAPSWIDPQDPARPAGLGPVPGVFPARRKKREKVAIVDGGYSEIPAGFDWTCFQAAPDDQQLERLVGDEWIALDGLHPVLPRLAFQLPRRRAAARLVDATGREVALVELALDRVLIDTDQQRVTLLHRAAIAVDLGALAGARIEVGSGLLGGELTFADASDPVTARGAPAPVVSRGRPGTGTVSVDEPRRNPLAGTMMANPAAVAAAVTPFRDAPAAAPPALAPPAAAAPPPLAVRPADPLRSTFLVDHQVIAQPATPFAGAEGPRAAPRDTPLEGLPFQGAPPAGEPATPPVAAAAPTPAATGRRGEKVPTRTDAPMQVVTITWQLAPPQEQLVVIVKASFVLTHGAQSPLSAEPDLPIGDVFADDDLDGPLLHASDFAVIKPSVDVLVTGHAYAPGGKPTTAMQVVVRLKGRRAQLHRELAVFGDRTWQGGIVSLAPTDPAPFTRIPLTWERAFGGPELGANPSGVSHRGARAKDGAARLPNFEVPGKLVRAPDDTPPPAGLGPIHPLWPVRWGLLGTYDKAWFRTRWPYFAPDFDPEYFQAAPVAQRLSALDGDEDFELVGLHPTHGTLRGALPNARARAFAQKTKAKGGGFVEVSLALDTLTFEPDRDRGHLVWRGRLDVSDDDAPEIEEIFVTMEPVRGPALTLDEARARYRRLLEEEKKDVAGEAPPATPGPEVDDEELRQADEEARALEAKIAEHEAKVRAGAPDAPDDGAPPPPPDVEALARTLRESGASEADVAALVGAMTGKSETEPPPAPPVDLRAFVLGRVAAGEPLSALDLRRADLRDLDLARQSLAGSDLGGALLDRAKLDGVDLSGARLVGSSLVAAALPGAKLDGADVTGADLSGADLTGASLVAVEGEGVKLVDAKLRSAILDDAMVPSGDWSGADAEGLQAENLHVFGSRLDRARFTGAKLVALRLYDSTAREAVFDRADLTNARVEGATLTACSFRDVSARESIWERAVLDTTTFQGADLVEASFTRATCRKTSFNEADLSNARLRKARLNGATFVRANLMEATLDKADLELADLRGANLHAAFIHKTRLDHAKTEHAIVTQSALGRKQP